MLTITFHPESDRPELIQATVDYQRLWDSNRKRMLDVIARVSSLSFTEGHINAVVFEGVSFSQPLMLRASYLENEKKGTLIHELCHRLLVGNGIRVVGLERDAGLLLSHKQVNLILFDIFTDFYGEAFAADMVRMESDRRPFYEEAWKWALALSREDRAQRFALLISGKPLE